MGNLTSTPTFTQTQADTLYQPRGNYALSTQHTALDSTVGNLRNTVSGIDTRITGINTSVGNLASSFNTFSSGLGVTIGNLIAADSRYASLNTSVGNLVTGFNGINNTIGALVTSVGNLSTLSAMTGSPLAQRTLWCATGEFCPLPAGKGMQIGDYTLGVNNNRLCVRRGTGMSYCFDGTNLSAITSGTTGSTGSIGGGP